MSPNWGSFKTFRKGKEVVKVPVGDGCHKCKGNLCGHPLDDWDSVKEKAKDDSKPDGFA